MDPYARRAIMFWLIYLLYLFWSWQNEMSLHRCQRMSDPTSSILGPCACSVFCIARILIRIAKIAFCNRKKTQLGPVLPFGAPESEEPIWAGRTLLGCPLPAGGRIDVVCLRHWSILHMHAGTSVRLLPHANMHAASRCQYVRCGKGKQGNKWNKWYCK